MLDACWHFRLWCWKAAKITCREGKTVLFCLKWNSADPPVLSSCALQWEGEVPWIFRVQWLSHPHILNLLSVNYSKDLSRCQDPAGQSDLCCCQWHLSNVGRCLGRFLISAVLFLLDWVDDKHMAKALELQMCCTV